MATMGNLVNQLQRLTTKGLTSTEVQPILKTAKGHLFGFCFMTAPETVLSAVTNGFITAFAPGAIVFCMNSVGTGTTFIVFNTKSSAAPSWTAVCSVAP